MSDASLHNSNRGVSLPPALSRLFDTLRRQLKQYAFLSGLLFMFCVVAAVFWLTSAVDVGWFALQRLELPVGLRLLLLIGMLGGGGWLLFQHVIRPVVRRIRNRDLALALERKYPDFNDGLITAVETTSGYSGDGPAVSSMLQRTVSKAEAIASSVRADDVFDTASLKKSGWIAGLLLCSLAVNALLRPGSLTRWFEAFVLCEETYHLRTTRLDIAVVAQPNDRRMSFDDLNGRPTYLHPRGSDLELLLTVPDGNSPAGVPWVMPQRARIDVIREDGTRSRSWVSSTSDNSFRFILTRLQESVAIEILAGDFRTPRRLHVDAVVPPSVDTISADCRYPEYTGWNSTMQTNVSVRGSELALPVGTEFDLVVYSNKPLVSATISSDLFEITGDRQETALTTTDARFSLNAAGGMIDESGTSIRVPMRIIADNEELSAESASEQDEQPESGGSGSDESLAVPSNTSLRFMLHDEDNVVSVSAESLRVRGIPDKPPVVAVRATGVSNSITRQARVPFSGILQDDYGLVSARFQFLVDDRTEWSTRPLERRFTPGLQYDLEQAGESGSEYFSVQREELTEGQTIAVSIIAVDNCEIGPANETRAEPVVFRIVSNEELLSLLYTREVSLRRRFEEVIQRLEDIDEDLQFHHDVAVRLESAGDDAAAEDRIAVTTCATRTGNSLRQQTNELTSIAESFRDIKQELINNAIPPKTLAEQMDTNIVQPIYAAIQGPMDEVDRSLSRFRVDAVAKKPVADQIATSRAQVSDLIAELKVILEKVHDMSELHEALSDLKDILEEHRRIMKETKREQIRRLGLP